MRSRLMILVAMLGALAAAGCNPQPTEIAAAGALPPVDIPVGPIPGGPVTQQPRLNPYANDSIAIHEGRQLFVRYNCYGCHGGHGGGGMGPSLRDPDWIYGNSDAQVYNSIAEGRAHGMPTWGKKLPNSQIWQLVAYVKSLNTPSEPDAPSPPEASAPGNR